MGDTSGSGRRIASPTAAPSGANERAKIEKKMLAATVAATPEMNAVQRMLAGMLNLFRRGAMQPRTTNKSMRPKSNRAKTHKRGRLEMQKASRSANRGTKGCTALHHIR